MAMWLCGQFETSSIIETFGHHCATILGPFWDNFGIILGLFRDHFGMILRKMIDPIFEIFKKLLDGSSGFVGTRRFHFVAVRFPKCWEFPKKK